DLVGAGPQYRVEEPTEGGADAAVRGLGVQYLGERHGERGLEPREEFRRPARGAEAADGLEGRERVDQLRLVVAVLVVARGRGDRDPRRVRGVDPLPGLVEVRVDLKGQRGLRRDDLQQIRQARPEPGDDVAAQGGVGVLGDDLVERPATRTGDHRGRRTL